VKHRGLRSGLALFNGTEGGTWVLAEIERSRQSLHFKTERSVAAFIVKWFVYDSANRVCITGNPEGTELHPVCRLTGIDPLRV